jgi:hypothetical protein
MSNSDYWATAAKHQSKKINALADNLEKQKKNYLRKEVEKILPILIDGNKKKINKLNKRLQIYAKIETNKKMAFDLKNLTKNFSIYDICNFKDYDSEVIQDIVNKALIKWKNSSLEELPLKEVQQKLIDYVLNRFEATELQKGLLKIMKHNNDIASLIVAPTGAGKTFGFGAIMKVCSKNSIVLYSPANMQSLQDFVKATSSAGVKICFVEDINNSNEWVANYETLGKAKENSLQKMHESLKESASRTGKNRRNKKARSVFKGDTPTIIVADPSYRKIGLENLYNEVCIFASNFKGRDIHPTLVIDDFCASEQDIIDGEAAHIAMLNAKRVILLTATPPSNFDNVDNIVNIKRKKNGLCNFTVHKFPKTLGPGVELYSENNENYNLLAGNLNVFDKSPFALSTIPYEKAFDILKLIKGEIETRNFIIDNLINNISIDDIREEVIDEISNIDNNKKKAIFDEVFSSDEKSNFTSHIKSQVMYLDVNPLQRLKKQNIPIKIKTEDDKDWLKQLRNCLNQYMKRNQKLNITKKKLSNSKSKRHDGLTSEESDRLDSRDYEENFIFPNLNPIFTSTKQLNNIFSIADSQKISDIELLYLLQKSILLIEHTKMSWILPMLSYTKIIFADVEKMGAGVHINELRKVYLPEQDNIPPSLLIQAMGRVGRPRQGSGIVIGKKKQFNVMFSNNVGEHSAEILFNTIHNIFNEENKLEILKYNQKFKNEDAKNENNFLKKEVTLKKEVIKEKEVNLKKEKSSLDDILIEINHDKKEENDIKNYLSIDNKKDIKDTKDSIKDIKKKKKKIKKTYSSWD